ncbi:MAG TPA: hypothetical protein VH877_05680 [Polyangia bacterium]|nr:hypothetical protein [Polyangia bacterium]
MWRVRHLLRRYLLLYGGWYAAANTRQQPTGFDVDRFVHDFLDGRGPEPEVVALFQQLTEELAMEMASRPAVPGEGIAGRYEALRAAFQLSPEESDLVLLLLAPETNGGTAWFLRLITGDDRDDGLPVRLVRHVLDPRSEMPERIEAVLARGAALQKQGLVRLRDVDGRGSRVGLGEVVVRFLRGGIPGRPDGEAWEQVMFGVGGRR